RETTKKLATQQKGSAYRSLQPRMAGFKLGDVGSAMSKPTQRDPSASLRSARDDGGEERATTAEILKKIKTLEIKTRGLVETAFAGDYHSVFKGRGMNFEDVREYQPGDEIRAIDWNVTARMGNAYIKKFTEERELTVMLIVDVSAS